MKKFIALVFAQLFFLSAFSNYCAALNTSAQSAVLIEAESGKIIYEKNANEKRGMASTTKIMTAITAIENCDIDKEVKVSDLAIGVEGSSIYLQKGESLTMEELLYALMLQSANDAATAIAIEVSGSVEDFACLMNQTAERIGLSSTHFTNPHGLFDDEHYTTAHDLALITRYAMKNDCFKKLVSTEKKVIPLNQDNGKRVLLNHNKLLKIYDGAVGVKTGFTKKTGRCLVSAAQKDGITLIAVTLNAPDDWNDHRKMLDFGFEKVVSKTLAEPYSMSHKIAVVGGTDEYLYCTNPNGLKYITIADNMNITSKIFVDRFYFAPIKSGELIGHVTFYNNGEEIGSVELIATNDVAQKVVKKKFLGIF